jgi:hypothetical protein
MNWSSIVFASLGGALGALLGALIGGALSRGRESRTPFTVCVVLGALVGGQFIGPRLYKWNEVRTAEATLLEKRAFRVLKKYEPAAYAKVLAEYKLAVNDESRLSHFTGTVMTEVGDVVSRRMATASDDALLPFMQEIIEKLRRLQPNGDSCFRFLFPQVSGAPDPTLLVEKGSEDHMLEELANLISSSAEDPGRPATQEQIQNRLVPIVTDLQAQYGDALAMLSNPAGPRVDRAKVCSMTISLYDRILRLPPFEAGSLMRGLTQSQAKGAAG